MNQTNHNMNPDPIIHATRISKSFRNELGKVSRSVLQDLDFKVFPGEKVAVMGPSGSGKTTLLNLIGSLETPDAGEILINGQYLSEMDNNARLHFRNQQLGFVFQQHHLLPQCTLWENILLPSLPYRQGREQAVKKAGELIHLMGLEAQRDNKPGELSGGECQRAAVARALINDPLLLLADEPTGSLDEENAGRLMELLTKINKEMDLTLVVATHAREIAGSMDNIYRIRSGQLHKETRA